MAKVGIFSIRGLVRHRERHKGSMSEVARLLRRTCNHAILMLLTTDPQCHSLNWRTDCKISPKVRRTICLSYKQLLWQVAIIFLNLGVLRRCLRTSKRRCWTHGNAVWCTKRSRTHLSHSIKLASSSSPRKRSRKRQLWPSSSRKPRLIGYLSLTSTKRSTLRM